MAKPPHKSHRTTSHKSTAHKKFGADRRRKTASSGSTNPRPSSGSATAVQILHSCGPEFMAAWSNLILITPRDDYGFLTYFINHTMIPDDIDKRSSSARDDLVNVAKIPLSMVEGYLSFNVTTPCWNQLEHEPDIYWAAFRNFLQSPGRSLQDAERNMPPGFTPYTIAEAYYLYYWKDRAKAWDIMRPVAAARLRDTRVLATEDAHFQLAQSMRIDLLDELKKRGDENEGRPFAGMKTSEVFNAVMASMQAERVAIGLPGTGPLLKPIGFVPEPGAGSDKLAAASIRAHDMEKDDVSSPASKMRETMKKIFAENPDRLAELQQLALEVTQEARKRNNGADDQDTDAVEDDTATEDQ